jgi:hypothetical protein
MQPIEYLRQREVLMLWSIVLDIATRRDNITACSDDTYYRSHIDNGFFPKYTPNVPQEDQKCNAKCNRCNYSYIEQK